VIRIALTLLLVMVSPVLVCHAQRTVDPMQVIGRPVVAADGAKIGEVADVSTDETGEIDVLRVTTGIRLELGERQIAIPRPAFMIKATSIVLPDLTSEDVAAWPDDHAERGSPRQEER
jgi:PRC-barrel domain protein